MTWYVYILRSKKTERFYIGSTDNKERRLEEHNKDKNKSTKGKGPWDLVYFEIFNSRLEARRRELKIKSYKGGNAFRKLIEQG